MNAFALRERASPNYDRRDDPARIDMLVLHYTGMQSAAAALDRLCDPAVRVSAHYVVEEDGVVWQLVPETLRAFHAGISCWAGDRDLNRFSIGVEIVNPGHEWGYRGFPEAQMRTVEHLCRAILSRHPIPPHRVVGHSDIAPDRKTDPGELFDWSRLAGAGIGIWAAPSACRVDMAVDRAQAIRCLGAIGYCIKPASEASAVAAFQRRFRPACYDGALDGETAARIAEISAVFALSRRQ